MAAPECHLPQEAVGHDRRGAAGPPAPPRQGRHVGQGALPQTPHRGRPRAGPPVRAAV